MACGSLKKKGGGGGGTRGVLTHAMTAGYAKEIQQELGHGSGVNAAFDAIEKDDKFAAVMARLLVWSDPFPLPEVDQVQRVLHGWNVSYSSCHKQRLLYRSVFSWNGYRSLWF